MKYAVTVLSVVFACCSLAEEKHRIVSTDAGVTNILLSMGLGGRLVGVDVTSQLPEAMEATPRVGYHRQLSVEGLMALRPDIVIGSQDMAPASALRALRSVNVDIVQIPKAQNVEELLLNIDTIEQALGCEACASQLKNRASEKHTELSSIFTERHDYLFLMVMDQRSIRYAGSNTGGDALIQLIGGNNLAEHEGYRNLSLEGLLAIDPDVILVTGRSMNDKQIQTFKQQSPLLAEKKIVAVDGSAIISGISLLSLDEAIKLKSASL